MRYFSFLILSLISFAAQASPSGFETDISKTFAVAKKSGKPILIDFFGIWCPPCNELDETVFESSAFLKVAKGFHLLKVDADAASSWELKNRYKVGGYPTVIFTNSRGEEVYRIVGYRTAKEFSRVMGMVLAARGRNVAKACASRKEDDLWRCAVTCTEKKDTVCAERALLKLEKMLKPGSARYDEARGFALERAATPDLKRDGYERILRELPASPKAMAWALEYLDLFDGKSDLKPKAPLVEAVLSHYSEMKQDPRAEELGMSLTDLAQYRADLLDRLGKREESRTAWKEAATLLEAQAQATGDQPARGFALERMGAMENAGELDAALALAEKYRAQYPEEFTFHFVAGSLLNRAKRYLDAIPVARKAYQYSYGDNRLRAATLLVELLATVPDKAGAKTIYDEVRREIHPEKSLEVRTHRYLKKLDEAVAKLGIPPQTS